MLGAQEAPLFLLGLVAKPWYQKAAKVVLSPYGLLDWQDQHLLIELSLNLMRSTVGVECVEGPSLTQACCAGS
jgi:hypothetical protein